MDDPVNGPLAPTAGSTTTLRPVGVDGVTVDGGFWAERLAVNAAVSIPQGWEQLHRAGNIANLERITAGETGGPVGEVFADSDIYKWLEAAAWEVARTGDATLLEQQRDSTRIVAAAQADDGYLDSIVQLRGMARYSELGWCHELYCAGHLIQAAVAQRRATGDARAARRRRAARRSPGARPSARRTRASSTGIPVIETALVELYRETGHGGVPRPGEVVRRHPRQEHRLRVRPRGHLLLRPRPGAGDDVPGGPRRAGCLPGGGRDGRRDRDR